MFRFGYLATQSRPEVASGFDSHREMAVRQGAILQSAARLLKPGGRLVYATCSLLPLENEGIVDGFFAANSGAFSVLDACDVLTGLKLERAEALCSGGPENRRYLHLWPHLHGTDGFFSAVWQKK